MCLVLSLIPQSFTEQVRPKTKGEAKASDKATSKRRPAEEPYIYYVAGRWLHKLKKAGSFKENELTPNLLKILALPTPKPLTTMCDFLKPLGDGGEELASVNWRKDRGVDRDAVKEGSRPALWYPTRPFFAFIAQVEEHCGRLLTLPALLEHVDGLMPFIERELGANEALRESFDCIFDGDLFPFESEDERTEVYEFFVHRHIASRNHFSLRRHVSEAMGRISTQNGTAGTTRDLAAGKGGQARKQKKRSVPDSEDKTEENRLMRAAKRQADAEKTTNTTIQFT
jgi:hypothetical protein